MQSSVEQLEGLARKLTIEVPATEINQEVEKRLKDIRPRVRIDGFRPGKVPPAVIKQKYGAGIKQDVMGEMVEKSYREAIEAGDFSPAASPEIEILSGFSTDEPLKFTALFEVMPEVNINGMDALNITLPRSEICNQDIEEMITTLRKQQATFYPSDNGVEESNRVTVDFTGTIDGEVFNGGSGENVQFIIGEGQMLPDFENALKGCRTGEEKTFDVHFPADYRSEELAGKTAQFTVKVKQVEGMSLPELDEAFISRFGIKSADEAAFKEAIQENMTRELENALRRIRRHEMFEAILSHNSEQEIAEGSVRAEVQRMAKEMNLEKQIPDAGQREKLAGQIFDTPARRRVRLGLLVGKLFSDSQLELDLQRVDDRIKSISSTYEDPQEVIEWYQKDKKARAAVESAVLEEQLIDHLYESATVNYEDKTFREVMALNGQLRD